MTDLIERGEKLIRLTEVKAILVVNHCDQENLDRLLKRIEALPPATPWRPASELPRPCDRLIGTNAPLGTYEHPDTGHRRVEPLAILTPLEYGPSPWMEGYIFVSWCEQVDPDLKTELPTTGGVG